MLNALGIAARLRRKHLRLSISELSNRTGINSFDLINFELARTDIGVVQFRLIADGLNTTCEELMITADMLSSSSSVSDDRMKSRSKVLWQMNRMRDQNERLHRQLNKLMRQGCVTESRSIEAAERFSALKTRLDKAAASIEATKLMQDERELFLFRWLQHRSTRKAAVVPIR